MNSPTALIRCAFGLRLRPSATTVEHGTLRAWLADAHAGMLAVAMPGEVAERIMQTRFEQSARTRIDFVCGVVFHRARSIIVPNAIAAGAFADTRFLPYRSPAACNRMSQFRIPAAL